jgi:hypothetical protein
VLTLAEADAELQRLAILRKNHADEQFLARRNLRDLPDTIVRLSKRLSDLSADQATAAAHAGDPLTIGGRTCHRDDTMAILGKSLNSLPDQVSTTRRYPIGTFRGLSFGLVQHPNGAADVFLDGAATRHGMLSRDAHGPRAVLNALERLAATYGSQCDTARQELAIAEGQLRDYQSRLGVPFPHDAYLGELSRLRDQLKASLSNAAPEPGVESPTPVAGLAEQIKALKSTHTIEAAPQRTGSRRTAAEEPVTARIRRRIEPATSQDEAPSPHPTDKSAADMILPMRHHDGAERAFQTHDHALPNTDDASHGRAPDLPTKHNGRPIMATATRNLATAPETSNEETARGRTEGAQATLPPATQEGSEPVKASEARPAILTPDPRGVMSASLGDTKGSPRMRLLRSHKFKQMQVEFEQQPEPKYLAMLKEAGWTDRTESEGVWTKQVGQGQWQPVADAERLFKDIANAIRKDKGLEPVMQGLAA